MIFLKGPSFQDKQIHQLTDFIHLISSKIKTDIARKKGEKILFVGLLRADKRAEIVYVINDNVRALRGWIEIK